MKNPALPNWNRIVFILCGLMLIAVMFVPMWRIDLDAPQYPEGLRLLIYHNNIGGDVDIINGLNHYIGMKTIHASEFIEFQVLPYIISFFALLCIFVAAFPKRKLMYTAFILFLSFGVIAMIDFWKWEYDYGHNLNPEAAIIVPGMAYQPPLIGFKQLLNFGAYSIPDIGGWLFIGVGMLMLLCVGMDLRMKIKLKKNSSVTNAAAIIVLLITLTGCDASPEPIKIGIDHCQFCKMTISDPRYGAEVLTKKGKNYKFDDTHCLFLYLKEGELKNEDINDFYLADFVGNHNLISKKKSFFIKTDDISGPMGGKIITFSNQDSMKLYSEKLHGQEVSWDQIENN